MGSVTHLAMFAAPEHLQSQSLEEHSVSPFFMAATHESTTLFLVRVILSFCFWGFEGLLLGGAV